MGSSCVTPRRASSTSSSSKISRAPIGDLAGLGTRYPRLEDVVLTGTGDVVPGDLDVPRPAVRRSAPAAPPPRHIFEHIERAAWPALVELELVVRCAAVRRRVHAPRRHRCFAAPARLPALRVLRPDERVDFTDALCPAISLFGTLTDAGRGRARGGRQRAAPPARSTSNIDSCLSPRGLAQLRAAGLRIVEDPPFPRHGLSTSPTPAAPTVRSATATSPSPSDRGCA